MNSAWTWLGHVADLFGVVGIPYVVWQYIRQTRPKWYRWLWHRWPQVRRRGPELIFTADRMISFRLPEYACPECGSPVERISEPVLGGRHLPAWRCTVLDCICRGPQRLPGGKLTTRRDPAALQDQLSAAAYEPTEETDA
jgi:hypothetical protein